MHTFSRATNMGKAAMAQEKCAWTLSVPDAGKEYLGLSRNAAYAAAGRGEIPTVKIGRLLRVPKKAIEQMLETPARPTAA